MILAISALNARTAESKVWSAGHTKMFNAYGAKKNYLARRSWAFVTIITWVAVVVAAVIPAAVGATMAATIVRWACDRFYGIADGANTEQSRHVLPAPTQFLAQLSLHTLLALGVETLEVGTDVVAVVRFVVIKGTFQTLHRFQRFARLGSMLSTVVFM